VTRPAALLVGLHPWNGSVWTYAAYEELLSAAREADVVLLLPSGLGNSLYTADAEDEALRAIDALGQELAIDPDRVTLWGASMGGAGATTIGFHHPDRFAAIVSLFGDSKYDLTTYVKNILHDGTGAHLVNALDIVDNARNVPVWLVHGEDDRVSPLGQSARLDRALHAKGFTVTFDRVPGAGHEGRVVRMFARRIVERAARAKRVSAPLRVSYWSVRPGDVEAYGIRLTRAEAAGDAFFDLERVADTLHLRAAVGVRSLRIPRGAFQFAPAETPPIVCDDPRAKNVVLAWDAIP
jgi:predicted esterase